MYRILGIVLALVLWCAPAWAQVTVEVVGLDARVAGEHRAYVDLNGKRFSLPVPDAVTMAQVEAWVLDPANVSTKQLGVWVELAQTNFDAGNRYALPEGVKRVALAEGDLTQRERAMFRFMFQQINALRALHGEPAITKATVLEAFRTDMNTP